MFGEDTNNSMVSPYLTYTHGMHVRFLQGGLAYY